MADPNGGHPSQGSQSDVLGAILRELKKKGFTADWTIGTIQTAPLTTTDLVRVKAIPGWATAIYGYMISVEEACNLLMTWASEDGTTKTVQIPVASEGTIVLIIDGEAAMNEGHLSTGDIYIRSKANAGAGKDYQACLLVARRRV